MLELLILVTCAGILLSGVLAVCLNNLMAAMVSSSLASLLAAVSFLLLAAPDVAMAEAAAYSFNSEPVRERKRVTLQSSLDYGSHLLDRSTTSTRSRARRWPSRCRSTRTSTPSSFTMAITRSST